MAAVLADAREVPPRVEDLADPAGVLPAMLTAERLRRVAGAGALGVPDALRLIAAAGGADDHLVRCGALRVLSAVPGPGVDALFLGALTGGDPVLAEHAAWGLAARPVQQAAVRPLLGLVARTGFPGVLALAALEAWAGGVPQLTDEALAALDADADDGPARAALVAALGVSRGPAAAHALHGVAGDRHEDPVARATAVTALARHEGPGTASLLARLEEDDHVAVRQAARRCRLALATATVAVPDAGTGLGVVQVLLQGRLDGDLTAAGTGDGGGLVTLLVNLARELAAQPGVDRVRTLARDRHGRDGGPPGREQLAPTATIERLQAGPAGPLPAPDLWSHRLEIEAELVRLLRAVPGADVVHLRATDGGSWAAMRACLRLGIPYVATLAPDPHTVVRAAERAGTLSRATFAAVDAAEHWWFRIGLLGDLADGAAALAVFPRPGGTAELAALTGLDLGGRSLHVVPEGASLRATDQAAELVAAANDRGPVPPVAAELAARVDALGPGRRGLPLLVTAGRLHPVKGVDRLVEAWAATPALRDGFNLVVLGGDLAAPSAVERGVLQAVDAVLDRHAGARGGLVLLGARPHREVAVVLAVARQGLDGCIGPAGVYACASVKEEFGLAIVEALAAGLPVVGPDEGGPPTYVEDGVTGVLVDTGDTPALAAAVEQATALRLDPARAARARAHVATHVNLSAMAAALVAVYREATR